MKKHHTGYACEDIETAIKHMEKVHRIKSISPIVFDERQKVQLCMIETAEGDKIELVSGEPVKSIILQGAVKEYHICYEVNDIFEAINDYKNKGGVLLSSPKPAKLFDNKLIAFLQTPSGIIELLNH